MAEPGKTQIGDGSDDFGGAANQIANTAKQAGRQAAQKGAEAAKRAAGAAVKAGAEGGKAAAGIATGTAVGGPIGAALSAAWSLRHTLFKLLICTCLVLVFFVVLIVSIPSIVTNGTLGLDGNQPEEGASLLSSYTEMADTVSDAVDAGYDQSLAKVEQIITDGGYDYRLSMDALINHAQSSAGYDVCYILAAYSASLQQKGTSKADMLQKLNSVGASMFPVTYTEKQIEQTVEIEPAESGAEPKTETVIVKYAECTIHPFDNSVIVSAFGLDLDAPYDQFNLTYGRAIHNMADALKKTIYGSMIGGQAVPLTDAELIAFVNRQNCTPVRKHILSTALSLVGKVPYFWGGKSGPGWNEAWNTPRLVTAAGSPTSGTIRPYGLDCSGFTDWVYQTAVGVCLDRQWQSSYAISPSELMPGDLGFLMDDDGLDWNHVLMFAGYGENGQRMWVHSSGGEGVILNTPSYEAGLATRRVKNVDFDALIAESPNRSPLYSLEVDVTHYCACSLCCGDNADGITASGKRAARGMVAMSSQYPFGTQLEIGGVMYTVEDRGGSGIENDIHRVDIFIPDHNEALRLGRYKTTAKIYRIGR